MDREEALAEIVETAKRSRRYAPRWLWLVAAVIGGVFATLFVIAMLSTGDVASTTPTPAPRATGGSGFGTGVLVGLAAGIAIGLVIGRQVLAHSSRNRP